MFFFKQGKFSITAGPNPNRRLYWIKQTFIVRNLKGVHPQEKWLQKRPAGFSEFKVTIYKDNSHV